MLKNTFPFIILRTGITEEEPNAKIFNPEHYTFFELYKNEKNNKYLKFRKTKKMKTNQENKEQSECMDAEKMYDEVLRLFWYYIENKRHVAE